MGWVFRILSPLMGFFARRRLSALFVGFLGANPEEVEGRVSDYRTLAEFFQRPLKAGARPLADGPLVIPCDGAIVTCGPVQGGMIPQVKGIDYELEALLQNPGLAGRLAEGSQATIYLRPRDYHRVHAPFDAEITGLRRISGTLWPVRPWAVRRVRGLFRRNARTVFECALPDGRAAAVVMVGAYNVGDISVSCPVPGPVSKGDELGRFGFGSTVVVLVEQGGPEFAALEPGTEVRMGRPA